MCMVVVCLWIGSALIAEKARGTVVVKIQLRTLRGLLYIFATTGIRSSDIKQSKPAPRRSVRDDYPVGEPHASVVACCEDHWEMGKTKRLGYDTVKTIRGSLFVNCHFCCTSIKYRRSRRMQNSLAHFCLSSPSASSAPCLRHDTNPSQHENNTGAKSVTTVTCPNVQLSPASSAPTDRESCLCACLARNIAQKRPDASIAIPARENGVTNLFNLSGIRVCRPTILRCKPEPGWLLSMPDTRMVPTRIRDKRMYVSMTKADHHARFGCGDGVESVEAHGMYGVQLLQ